MDGFAAHTSVRVPVIGKMPKVLAWPDEVVVSEEGLDALYLLCGQRSGGC